MPAEDAKVLADALFTRSVTVTLLTALVNCIASIKPPKKAGRPALLELNPTSDKMLCSLQREESANHPEKLKCALTIIVKKLNRKMDEIVHEGQMHYKYFKWSWSWSNWGPDMYSCT
jgi:hypothetical protein